MFTHLFTFLWVNIIKWFLKCQKSVESYDISRLMCWWIDIKQKDMPEEIA